MMWWTNNGAFPWWGMAFGWLWMVLFWGAIILLITWGVRQVTGRSEGRRSPLDIAKERYARGEITKQQFEEIKTDLH